MDREQILVSLRRHAEDLRQLGASQLFLFGSVARGEAKASSDVDLFFDFDDPAFSIVELVALTARISAIVDAPADVMSRASIHPRLRPSVEAAAVRVF